MGESSDAQPLGLGRLFRIDTSLLCLSANRSGDRAAAALGYWDGIPVLVFDCGSRRRELRDGAPGPDCQKLIWLAEA